MNLGFIGTGALTSAIVTGLKSAADHTASILLSPRNAEVAAGLAARFADVRVAADNQAVLDHCDTIVLAVRPQVAHEVLSALRFHRRHHVVSLIAILSREEIASLTAPADRVTKALPIPMIAHRQGAILVHPPDPRVVALFGKLGKVIEVENGNDFATLAVATATFATYFRYLDTIQRWLKAHGIADERARGYVAALFQALGNAPEMTPNADFMHLAEEYATRGGINEQVLRELTARNLFAAVAESLDGVHRRMLGS